MWTDPILFIFHLFLDIWVVFTCRLWCWYCCSLRGQVFLWACVLGSLGEIPRSRIAGSGDNCVLPLEELPDFFQSGIFIFKLKFTGAGWFKWVLGGRGEGRLGVV